MRSRFLEVEVGEVIIEVVMQVWPVIESCAFGIFIGEGEAEWLDEVQVYIESDT